MVRCIWWYVLYVTTECSKPESSTTVFSIINTDRSKKVFNFTINNISNFYNNEMIFYRAVWIFVVGIIVLVGLCSYCGMLLYATYQHCDPITTQVRILATLTCKSRK